MSYDSYHSVVLRYGEHVAPQGGTIGAHQEVIDNLGHVWYGKFGRPLSHVRISSIFEQRTDGLMYIFLTGKNNLIIAEIDNFQTKLPESSVNEVPEYYRNSRDKISSWFRILRFIKINTIDVAPNVIVKANSTPILKMLKNSMSPIFYVRMDTSLLKNLINKG